MQIHESMFLLAQMCFSLDFSGFFMLDVFAIDRLCSSLISFSLIQEIMIPKQEKKKNHRHLFKVLAAASILLHLNVLFPLTSTDNPHFPRVVFNVVVPDATDFS